MWAPANVNHLTLVVGGALVLMGTSPWRAITVNLVGILFWLLTGLLAIPGPAAGAPNEVITRATSTEAERRRFPASASHCRVSGAKYVICPGGRRGTGPGR